MKIRPILERLGLVLFGFCLFFVLLEGALRAGSLFFGPRLNKSSAASHTILCLGDSHTYGVYYRSEKAYPGQLQALLDRQEPGRYQVVNLGVPGMNSSQIRAKLTQWLDEYRPQTIIVGAGINNVWNRSATQQVNESDLLYLRRLRVYRLYRLLRAAISDTRTTPESPMKRPKLETVTLEDGKGGVQHQDAQTGKVLARNEGNPRKHVSRKQANAILREDLKVIHQIAEASDVRLILLTYSAFPLPDRPRRYVLHSLANKTMREFSQTWQVDLIDVRERFLELLPKEVPRAEYFANEKEGHPNPRGYAEIATLAAQVILGSKPQDQSLLEGANAL